MFRGWPAPAWTDLRLCGEERSAEWKAAPQRCLPPVASSSAFLRVFEARRGIISRPREHLWRNLQPHLGDHENGISVTLPDEELGSRLPPQYQGCVGQDHCQPCPDRAGHRSAPPEGNRPRSLACRLFVTTPSPRRSTAVEWAHIVTHSTTKYMGTAMAQLGRRHRGRGRLDGPRQHKFPGLCTG